MCGVLGQGWVWGVEAASCPHHPVGAAGSLEPAHRSSPGDGPCPHGPPGACSPSMTWALAPGGETPLWGHVGRTLLVRRAPALSWPRAHSRPHREMPWGLRLAPGTVGLSHPCEQLSSSGSAYGRVAEPTLDGTSRPTRPRTMVPLLSAQRWHWARSRGTGSAVLP